MGKMEETIRAMQKKMNDLQQQQGDNTMGARDLVSLMETSNSNLVGILASQNKRAKSPERKPDEPKLLSKMMPIQSNRKSTGWDGDR